MSKSTHEPVTFLNSRGEVITNDPILRAQQLLGIDPSADDSDEEIGDEFEDLGGKELKALAKEREVDISGLRTVGEVREALRAAAAASTETDESEEAEED